MKSKLKIKSCPFCGSKEVGFCRTNERARWIRCSLCGADAPSARTRKEAFALWNKRPDVKNAVIIWDDEHEK